MSTSPKHTSHHELLAPAGSIEAFFAAMEAGADAVYCGLKEFSARAKAKNFTLAETERLTAYAHQQGRRLYVPVNTLIKEAELPRLIEVLAELASFSVDGLIIQDFGLWRLARQHFPDLPLHASTQMTIHNAAGVKMLEQMGFSRAVLARELSLDEISAIRQQTTIELEHFVHGALCYSVSGQCLFSSYLTGNSGNRGRCAQPCRRRYRERGKEGFYFSTSDFCTIKLLPKMMAAGVMSFKIEGRMKNAEYVSTVVSAYRSVLDASPANQSQAIREADEALAEAYGRATTTGLLKGSAPVAIAAPATKGGIGRLLGVVERIQGNAVSFRTAAVVHVGDRLRIQPQSDLAGSAFTVQELFVEQKKVKRAAADSVILVATPFRGIFQKGDQVYKVSTGKGFTMSEEACQRRLAAVDLPQVLVQLSIYCRETNRLTLDAKAAGCKLTKEYEVEMLPASHSPLAWETLQPTFVKTGHALIRLGKFEVGALPAVVVKPSRLNEVRRDFYAALSCQVEAAFVEQRAKRIADVTSNLLPASPPRAVDHTVVMVVARGSRDLAVLEGQSMIPAPWRIIMPLTPANVDAVLKQGAGGVADQNRIFWDIPALIFEGEWRSYHAVVGRLIRQGYCHFRLNNLSHFSLFSANARPKLLSGPWIYVLNSQAALAVLELGAQQFTLSVEDDRENMAAILAREVGEDATVVVYTPIDLITSRIPMRSMPQGAVLETDSGDKVRLDLDDGLTVACADLEFSLSGQLHELRRLGCREFIVDLSAAGLTSKRGRAVLTAVLADEALADTSPFNFERGLA